MSQKPDDLSLHEMLAKTPLISHAINIGTYSQGNQAHNRGQNLEISHVYKNTSQEIIETTTDKLKLNLIEHLDNIEDNKAWQMPFGLVITIVLVFVSADFKEVFHIKAVYWATAFFIGGVASAVWFLYCLMKIKKSITIDDVIAKIQNKSSTESK